MSKTKSGMFSVWKIIGLVIAIGALAYRLICNAVYIDDITKQWGGLIFLFFAVYAVNLMTILTTFTRGKLTLILSIVMISVSMCIVCFDGLMFIGSIVSLADRTMSEQGLFPLAFVINTIAAFFDFIGFFSIRKKDRKKLAQTTS